MSGQLIDLMSSVMATVFVSGGWLIDGWKRGVGLNRANINFQSSYISWYESPISSMVTMINVSEIPDMCAPR